MTYRRPIKAVLAALTAPSSSSRRQKDDESALLIAALDHAWTTYDARLNRGLQTVSYYLIAAAVLANAYVSAFNARLYAVAAVIALTGLALTTVTSAMSFRQRRLASLSEEAMIELQDRVANRLGIGAFRIQRQTRGRSGFRGTPFAYVALGICHAAQCRGGGVRAGSLSRQAAIADQPLLVGPAHWPPPTTLGHAHSREGPFVRASWLRLIAALTVVEALLVQRASSPP
jgi:hypothetical protein